MNLNCLGARTLMTLSHDSDMLLTSTVLVGTVDMRVNVCVEPNIRQSGYISLSSYQPTTRLAIPSSDYSQVDMPACDRNV